MNYRFESVVKDTDRSKIRSLHKVITMKNFLRRAGLLVPFVVFVVMLTMVVPVQKADADVNVSINFQTFYDTLSPYGNWVQDPDYGYVWIPRVGHDFRPYTRGHWVMTEYGNLWVSNYSWGWAPFHYGRWEDTEYYGWVWIPGHDWGPAWVCWRSGGGYYGWAPLGPRLHIGINFSFGNDFYVPNDHWNFVPYTRIYEHNYDRYYVRDKTVNIIQNTTIINNTYVNNHTTYISGPRVKDVEVDTHKQVKVYKVDERGSEGSSRVKGTSVRIYHPVVNNQVTINNHNGNRTDIQMAPRHITKVDHPVFSEKDHTNIDRNANESRMEFRQHNSPSNNWNKDTSDQHPSENTSKPSQDHEDQNSNSKSRHHKKHRDDSQNDHNQNSDVNNQFTGDHHGRQGFDRR